jgi:myo-inositol 2-dehydrogenase / D-chiro-inositol 1-dehydrogenase
VTERLRVAVVGAGWWGGQHARIFAGRTDTELCAIVGRRPERATARATEYGVAAYTDLDQMLAEQQPDLVSVCLPNLDQFAPTVTLLRAGVPLLVEKPLVFDLDEADALLAEADRRGTFFAINFNHRYAKAVQQAKARIDGGQLGAIVFATWRFGGEGSSAHHPYADLIETQCHGFDLLEHLCGPVASLMAEMTDIGDTGPGTLVVALRFASGAVGSLVGSYATSYAYAGTHLLEVNGVDGRVVVEDTVRSMTFQARGSETAEVWRAGYFDDRNRSFMQTFDRHVHAVVKALRAGEPPPVPAAAGRRALALAWAAIGSYESGKRVEVERP